jgi:DNA-directed RNA polymerase subunit RPC12/RpoP
MNKKPYTLYFCDDCQHDFIVKVVKKSKYFCPYCGDTIAVRKVKKLWIEREYGYKSLWTREEDETLLRLLFKGYTHQEIANQIRGRTKGAVRTRIQRLRDNGQFDDMVSLLKKAGQ